VDLTEDQWQKYLGELRVGSGRYRAARAVGKTKASMGNWLRHHADRASEAQEAEAEALEAVESVLWEAAQAGEPWAVKLWLKERAPERWATTERGSRGATNVLVVSPDDLARLVQETGGAGEGTAAGPPGPATPPLALPPGPE
jgi:hypothetical protein